MRSKITRIMIGLLVLFLSGFAQNGIAQDASDDVPEEMRGKDLTITEVKPTLETMGLIWIQEGNVKRLAYVVQTGDTLWDIAERYLNSPYYWPKIWERNSFIINPHLIFPGDILYIYPEGIVEKPYEEMADITEVTPYGDEGEVDGEKVVYLNNSSVGFVSAERVESAGRIVDNPDHVDLLGEGDRAYVDVGKVNWVKIGDRYNIFRIVIDPKTGKYQKINHPITGELVGYQVRNLGVLEIVKVEPKLSTVRIVESYTEIRNGDMIVEYTQPLEEEVDLVRTDIEAVDGYIVATKNAVNLVGENDVVYIDKGGNHGVERGNTFKIYNPCYVINDPVTNETVRIPEEIIGELVILETQEKTSAGLVTYSTEEMTVGEQVFMSKFDTWEIEGVSQEVDLDRCASDPKCRIITEDEYAQGMDNPYCDQQAMKKEEKKKSRWTFTRNNDEGN